MICGLISPKRIKINDRTLVNQLCFITKTFIFISNSYYLIKLLASFSLVVFLSQLLFIIHMSSQLYDQAKYSNILFNSYVSHTKQISIMIRLKVFLVSKYIYQLINLLIITFRY